MPDPSIPIPLMLFIDLDPLCSAAWIDRQPGFESDTFDDLSSDDDYEPTRQTVGLLCLLASSLATAAFLVACLRAVGGRL